VDKNRNTNGLSEIVTIYVDTTVDAARLEACATSIAGIATRGSRREGQRELDGTMGLSMAYSMHRIFCATPGDLEEEREAFYSVMAKFNETKAMPRGILFVSLSIVPGVADKRAFQPAVSENIRTCRYYIQVLEDTWGPPEKNFERDHALAVKCAADPDQPMQDVAVLFKKPLLPHQVEPSVSELKRSRGGELAFETIEQYREHLWAMLSKWLETVPVATTA